MCLNVGVRVLSNYQESAQVVTELLALAADFSFSLFEV